MSKKLSYDFIQKYFEDEGYELLEQGYTNAHCKMKCLCPEGHKYSVNWNAFKNGTRCSKCFGNHKLTHQKVAEFFKSQNCILEDVYKNSATIMNYICECGKKSRIRFRDFKKGQRCKDCGLKKYSGENHPRWIQNRELVDQQKLFKQKVYDALKYCLKQIGATKKGRTYELLGYTFEDLKKHLESHPEWRELNKTNWSLDHIFPIKAFIEHEIYDIRLINCLENLQPMSISDNSIKNDSYDRKEFDQWFKKQGRKYDNIQGYFNNNLEI
jgi:hypothetical protein